MTDWTDDEVAMEAELGAEYTRNPPPIFSISSMCAREDEACDHLPERPSGESEIFTGAKEEDVRREIDAWRERNNVQVTGIEVQGDRVRGFLLRVFYTH